MSTTLEGKKLSIPRRPATTDRPPPKLWADDLSRRLAQAAMACSPLGETEPQRIGSVVNCTAPIRICDLGGWTDTWFARRGKILNIAVFPPVEVTIATRAKIDGEPTITIFAKNFGDCYHIPPESNARSKHPLIEAVFRIFRLPCDLHLDVTVYSEAPAGASTGTSAAVSVGLIGALDLICNCSMTSSDIASKAHYIESELLHQQSGVQDQLSSAYGGINFIEINHYPEASVSPVRLNDEAAWELESRLLLVYLGKPHSSSAVHVEVIRRLEDSPFYRRFLEPLRVAALSGKQALLRGDLDAFGAAMIENTTAQRQLHPGLVGERAQRVIELAKAFGVAGYKVNGAGGPGGSVTLLLKTGAIKKHELIKELEKDNPDFRNIPVRLAPPGLRRCKRDVNP
jgi:D-glycero-alpha-D-manno-heptose-7-phosphate kinase